MKVALLKGNRFNPWHLQGYTHLRDRVAVTAFRAESEIQRHYDEQNDGLELGFRYEQTYYDTQAGNPLARVCRQIGARYGRYEPRLLPFHERLRGFDLIHTWELFPDWTAEALTARKRFGVPVAVMVWDNIAFNMERTAELRTRKQRAMAEADAFLVHTERSRRVLEIEGAPAGRIIRFNPGVDTELFAPGPSKRSELGLGEDEFVILFVGWLLPRKGIDFLTLAIRELLHDPVLKGHKIRFVMVGAALGQDRVKGLIRRLGIEHACTFLGSTPYGRMPDIFRAADVFALPSVATDEWQEQFGMSIIEAMACGVPVVTTFSGAIPEVVGDSAVLCQPNDFVALYEALKRLLQNPEQRKDLALAGRGRALEQFELKAHAQSLLAAYARVLGRSAVGGPA